MKTKTATIQAFPLFQANGYGGRMLYRGKCLVSAVMADKLEVARVLADRARFEGFTSAKFLEDNSWGKVTVYKVRL